MREICTSGSTRGQLMSDSPDMVRGSRVRRNVRSPSGIDHQRSTLLPVFIRPLSLLGWLQPTVDDSGFEETA